VKILAVDYGQKNIGLALGDDQTRLAHPLRILPHLSRAADCAAVLREATLQQVERLIVGVSYDEQGSPNLAGRQSLHFVQALQAQTSLPVLPWDETLTTRDARAARLASGARRKDRAGHLDATAAALLLLDYLENLP